MDKVLQDRWLKYQGTINGAGLDMKMPFVLGWDERLERTQGGAGISDLPTPDRSLATMGRPAALSRLFPQSGTFN